MFEIRAIGIVAPALDLRNAGVNAAGGVGDEVSNVAIVGACVARAAESKVIASVELPNWNHVQQVLRRARLGLEATDLCKSAQGWTIN